jgi:hypothetical protein
MMMKRKTASLPFRASGSLNALAAKPLRAQLRRVICFRASLLLRSAFVALAMVAWVIGSNHCALRLLAGERGAAAVHQCCQAGETEKVPAKDDGTVCCRALHAVMTDGGKALELAPPSFIGPCDWIFAERIVSVTAEPLVSGEATGPPRAASFSESVLQRSLQAHAPPRA